MKLLLDLQGCQTPSRLRGIGRYSMALARGILRNNPAGHDVFVAVSNGAPDTIAPIRDALADLLPHDHFKIWATVKPCAFVDPANQGRLARAQVVREAFLASLRPDVVHCSSVVEGIHDNAVTTIGLHLPPLPTAATLYDLIPALDPDRYLPFPWAARWYRQMVGSLRRADLLLAISESAAREGVEVLGYPAERITNIRAAADDVFVPRTYPAAVEDELRTRLRLPRPFVLYSGGFDPRKNVAGLVRAFAALPPDVRDAYQVAIVGPTYTGAADEVLAVARGAGLTEGQVVVTGYVDEDDIVALYNLARAFMFPSHHEGFGLPPLEAMRCGTPTIASDNSSIPEVIGNPEAMFDSRDQQDMTDKLLRVLTDEEFRERLRTSGLAQAATFSWDDTARRALGGLEELAERSRHRAPIAVPPIPRRPRLALVSGLPPRGTQARKAVVTLIENLDRHYRVDLVTRCETDDTAFMLEAPAGLVAAEAFSGVAGRYDRILYRYTNSPDSGFVLGLQAMLPGTVLLEDASLDEALPGLPAPADRRDALARALVTGYGYAALHDYQARVDAGRTPPRRTFTAPILRRANGLIVTHPEIAARLVAEHGEELLGPWAVVPPLVAGALRIDGRLRPPATVAALGRGGSRRLLHRLVAAWLASSLSHDPGARLVFAGQDPNEPYGRFLTGLLEATPRQAAWAFVPETEAEDLLDDVRVAVQLSAEPDADTTHWTQACTVRGIAVVSNGTTPLPREFGQADLVRALESAWEGAAGARAAASATQAADAYVAAIERFHAEGRLAAAAAILRTAAQADEGGTPEDATATADALAWNDPWPSERQLLLDVSNVVFYDARTGIQRVVRNIVRQLTLVPPKGFRVEPVYADDLGVFHYARDYTAGLLGLRDGRLVDEPLVANAGDVFVGLDPSTRLFAGQIAADGKDILPSEGAVMQLRAAGVHVQFVVYDLIPLAHPEWFPADLSAFPEWVAGVVARGDGLIAISRATADAATAWMADNAAAAKPVAWFHMGADLEAEAGAPAPAVVERWEARGRGPTLLMVGTIEPRKGHDQVLDAFELLWSRGVTANLVVAGRYGWKTPQLANRLRDHPQARAGRLLWLDDAGDADLEFLYDHADGCLLASRAEGFGLPLVEAARHRLPVLVRDLPVFREVAGEHATYFGAEDAETLAEEITSWLLRFREGTLPDPATLPWKTWAESAVDFMAAVRSNMGTTGQTPG